MKKIRKNDIVFLCVILVFVLMYFVFYRNSNIFVSANSRTILENTAYDIAECMQNGDIQRLEEMFSEKARANEKFHNDLATLFETEYKGMHIVEFDKNINQITYSDGINIEKCIAGTNAFFIAENGNGEIVFYQQLIADGKQSGYEIGIDFAIVYYNDCSMTVGLN